MIIPLNQVNPETLLSIIEAFVLREGTDYGDVECSLEQKVAQVLQQLESGQALLVYSELHESVDILPRDQLSSQQSED